MKTLFYSLFLTCSFILATTAVNAQCCGNGVCEVGEDATNCPSDCAPVATYNCAPARNVIGSYFDASLPLLGFPSEAGVRAANTYYTFTPPYPAEVCFQYKVPTVGMFMGLVIKTYDDNGAPTCNQTLTPKIGSGVPFCGTLSIFGSSIVTSFSTYADACTLIRTGTNIEFGNTGACLLDQQPGDIITVCFNLDQSFTCDSLLIAPLLDCGGSTCATPPVPPVICPPSNFTKDSIQVTCKGNLMDGVVYVTPACGSHFSYEWNNDNTKTDSVLTGLAPGMNTVIIQNDSFLTCFDTLTVTVDTADYPTIIIATADTLTCIDTNLVLNATGTSTTNTLYQWTTIDGGIVKDDTTLMPTINKVGVYTLLATDTANGCPSEATVEVFFKDEGGPTAYYGATPDRGVAPLQVQFSDSSIGALTYEWTFGDNTNETGNTNPIHTYTEPGTYPSTLTVTGVSNCSSSFTYTIIIDVNFTILIPNVFTPNGDLQNDNFKILVNDEKTFQLNIFNRWGKQVFETNSALPGWDGQANGKDASEGAYFYVLHIVDKGDVEHEFKGSIQLLR